MIRAVIYCRCSTEEESQKDALTKQVAEAENCVRQQGWTLVDSYVESRSGTTTKGRSQYNRLVEDLKQGKMDVIVIKSQDRLMRDVGEWYRFIRILSEQQKKLFMYLEGKYYTPDDSLLTGIKAILADEYSRELSKKINNSHRNRQKNNGNIILTNNAYGFKKLPDKTVVLIEEEAQIKKKMYELCAAGYGSRTIATILKNQGILNRNGKPFTDAMIRKIIHNPINYGTHISNRLHYDFESKKTIKVPEEEQFVHENKVPATVSKELWEAANLQIANRRSKQNNTDGLVRGKNPGKFALTGKIVCGLCGEPYYRRGRTRYKKKDRIYDWKCRSYLLTGRNSGKYDRPQLRKVTLDNIEGCDNVHLNEERLENLLEQICEERYLSDKEKIISDMISILRRTLKEKDIQPEIDREEKVVEKLKSQQSVLVDKLLEGVISDEIYQMKQNQIEQKLEKSKKKVTELEAQKTKGSVLENRISQIEKMLKEGNAVEKASVEGMLEDVRKIVVYPEYMEIHFSYGRLFDVGNELVDDDTMDEIMVVKYGHMFDVRKKHDDDLQVVVDIMRDNPKITAKEIAKQLGITTSGVQQRITKLRKQQRIKYIGKGGKGIWEVMK